MVTRLNLTRKRRTLPPVPNREDDLKLFWHISFWIALKHCNQQIHPMDVDLLGSLFYCKYIGGTQGGAHRCDSGVAIHDHLNGTWQQTWSSSYHSCQNSQSSRYLLFLRWDSRWDSEGAEDEGAAENSMFGGELLTVELVQPISKMSSLSLLSYVSWSNWCTMQDDTVDGNIFRKCPRTWRFHNWLEYVSLSTQGAETIKWSWWKTAKSLQPRWPLRTCQKILT